MDDLETITTETAQDATIDLAEARARLADLQAQAQAQERVIVEEELRQAEAAHGALLEQCETAQAAFD